MEMKESCKDFFRVYGMNMRITREFRGLTLQQLAEISGYNREDLSTLENGEHDIYMKNSIKIAKVLDIDYPMFFSRSFIDGDKENQSFIQDDFLSIFAENVHRELKMKHRNQTSLQVGEHLDASTISRLLNQRNDNPVVSTLHRIAKSLDKDIESLLRRTAL